VDKGKNGSANKLALILGAFSALMAGLFWSDLWLYNSKVEPNALSTMLGAPISYFENIAFDKLFLFGANTGEHIAIAAVDDIALKELGWPFPRKYYADLIEKLNKLGAKTIAFDMMFADPDHRDPEGDRRLVEATAKAGNVIHCAILSTKVVEGGKPIYELRYPYGNLADGSYLLAQPNVEVTLDSDQHLRNILLFHPKAFYGKEHFGVGCSSACASLPIPSLSLATYASFSKTPLPELYAKYGNVVPQWFNFPPPSIYPQNPGRVKEGENLEYTKATYPHISILDILQDKLTQEQKDIIKDGVIFAGSTSLGLFDHRPNSFFTAPGVEFHAVAFDNLQHNSFLRPVNPWISFLLMLALIWLPFFCMRFSPVMSAMSAAVVLFGWTFACAAALVFGHKMQYVMPIAGYLISFVGLTVYRVVVEGQEKRWIKSTFGQYVSPKFVDVLVKDPSKLRLGGEKKEMTVFFLDIAHFTTISEKMDPAALTQFLNTYLTALTDVILRHEGFVDKYIGDCIMAFWNAPLDVPEHRLMGILSAVECLAEVERLNKQLVGSVIPEPIAVRVGINSGSISVGNMGSTMRFSYTVIGDDVNLASRLEGANKFFGSRIMASESAFAGAEDKILARRLGRLRVVGKSIPIQVYEPLAKKGAETAPVAALVKAYEEGYDLFYKKDFRGALAAFTSAEKASPGDGPSKFYIKLCEEYLSAPPAADWDGVFNLTSK